MKVEDQFIVPRVRALIAIYGNATHAAKALIDATDCGMSHYTVSTTIRHTQRGMLVNRRPSKWTLPWPYHLVEDRPCTQLEFREMLVGAKAAVDTPPVPLPKETFPDPPIELRQTDVVRDATGRRPGEEIASVILEPKFENVNEVPRDLTTLVDGFQRAQAEKKRHEASQTRAMVDLTNVRVPALFFAHSDIHWGSEDTDYDAIARHAALAKRPNTYVFMLGDINEYASLKHRGAIEGQIHSPTVQARAARAWLLEVWPALLAVLLGNHDMRIFIDSGFDIGEYLFTPPEGQQRVPFMRDGGLVVVRHGDHVYTHNLFHGDSAFGTRFNENHKGRQTARLVDGRCDVTWNGHTHNPAIQDTSEPSDDMAGARDAVYCQAGSYKVHGDDYARRRKFLVVPDVQMPAVVTFPDIHLALPFKRVETAVFFHELAVKHYAAGGSITDFYTSTRDIVGLG